MSEDGKAATGPLKGRATGAVKGRYSDLPLRIVSALVLAGSAMWCSWMGGTVFLLLIAVFSALILFEFSGMVQSVLPLRVRVGAGLILALVIAAHFVGLPDSGVLLLLVGAVLLILWESLVRRSGWGGAGLLYAGLPFAALSALRPGEGGLFVILFTFACVWGADTFAYFAGKGIGGPKLAPAISPNKTWSGFFGGFAGAIVISSALALALGHGVGPASILLAVVLALFCQIGDLFESWVKRRFGLKDSGWIIPGHGGVLDRIDGFIFAIVVLALIALVLPASGDPAAFGPLSDHLMSRFFAAPL